MIPQNLKVGETFTDGGRIYEVVSVNADGTYISKFVSLESEKPVVKTRRKKED